MSAEPEPVVCPHFVLPMRGPGRPPWGFRMATAIGTGAEVQRPLATVVIGGILLSAGTDLIGLAGAV